MAKSIWKSGDSRSLRLRDKISYEAYELLNSEGTLIKRSRNDFITNAINSQTIIEQGNLEDKLRLLGITDFMKSLSIETITKLRDLNTDTTPGEINENIIEENIEVKIDEEYKEDISLANNNHVTEDSKLEDEVVTSKDMEIKPNKNLVLEDIIGILSSIPDKK